MTFSGHMCSEATQTIGVYDVLAWLETNKKNLQHEHAVAMSFLESYTFTRDLKHCVTARTMRGWLDDRFSGERKGERPTDTQFALDLSAHLLEHHKWDTSLREHKRNVKCNGQNSMGWFGLQEVLVEELAV